jgi:DNA-binding transcriptional LysR family regulator
VEYELKDIQCFVQLARAGSMTHAARIYNLPKATLSHHLRRLEDALKVELFTRKTKGLELTEAGRGYLAHCVAIFDACETAAGAAQRAHSSESGKVTIAASSEFGTSITGSAAYFVSTANPQMDFDLKMYPNDKLIAGDIDFDCMIYVGDAPDSGLLRRKMGEVSNGLYASPEFIQRFGLPKHPDDVGKFNGIAYHRGGVPEPWQLSRDDERIVAACYPRFSVNDYWMAKFFAVQGSAIGYLPDFFVHYEVHLGALIPVLPEWRSDKSNIYITYPAHRHRNPRVMNVIDAMCKHFADFVTHPGYSLIRSEIVEFGAQAADSLHASETSFTGNGIMPAIGRKPSRRMNRSIQRRTAG